MRRTEDLILMLAMDVRKVPRHAIAWRLALAMGAGGAVTLALVVAVLGLQPNLELALGNLSFWVRWIYTGSLAVGAVIATSSLARPDSGRRRGFAFLAIPVLVLMGIGIADLARAPVSDWMTLWLGHVSWQACPWRILWLSAPIFVGLLWAFRQFAPTRPARAGATAGLAAGAWSATLYGLHCPEMSAIFVLSWFSLGIAMAAGLGALLGRRLLRW